MPSRLPQQPLVLMPGQWYFGRQPGRIRTLLGSCVAMTLWHPKQRVGGMCHYLLPERSRSGEEPLDGRFADEALALMVAEMPLHATRPEEYDVHLFGGADTFPEGAGIKFNIGQRNIETGWNLVERYGFNLQSVDVGDCVPRTVTLDLDDGSVHMCRRRGTLLAR